MAQATKKRKVRKNIPSGVAHIHATFNKEATCSFMVQSTDGNKLQVPVKILAM